MRLAHSLPRLLFAIVFAVTSLVHGPAMTARAVAGDLPCHDALPSNVTAMQHHDRHAHMHDGAAATATEEPASADTTFAPGAVKVCPMPGCFLMVSPALPAAPLPIATAAQLDIKPSQRPVACTPDPADPPPRLRV